MITKAKVTAIAEILKKRFTNLTVTTTVDIAFEILEALEKENEKENK